MLPNLFDNDWEDGTPEPPNPATLALMAVLTALCFAVMAMMEGN